MVPSDPAWRLEQTAFYVTTEDPLKLWGRVLAHFQEDGGYQVAKLQDAKASVKVWRRAGRSTNAFLAKVRVFRLHPQRDIFALEWQKRAGCSVASFNEFSRFQRRFAQPLD